MLVISGNKEFSDSNAMDEDLLWAAIRFNARILAVVSGILASLLFFIANAVSLAKWGGDAGEYLIFFAVFFPGYDMTTSGILAGCFWIFIYGAIAGGLVYSIYGAIIGRDIASSYRETESSSPLAMPAVLRLNRWGLGFSLGAMSAILLFLSTMLVLWRGHPEDVQHARMLANYLPGYEVSVAGSLRGALMLFAWVFAASLFLATVYNKLVVWRHG